MDEDKEIDIVELDIRRRIEEGILKATGFDIRGNDDEYHAYRRLCRLAEVEPMVSTYEEMDAAVKTTFAKWQVRAKLLEEQQRQQKERERGYRL